MFEMMQKRRAAETKEADLLSNLVGSNENSYGDDAKSGQLTDDEIVGNIFIFLLAGHETTAHTFAYVFIFLALYQDEQEILYKQVSSVCPDGKIPAYEDMGKLNYALAVFYETLRFFAPVSCLPKHALQDTSFTTRNLAGEPVPVAVPKGSLVSIHIAGLQRNPRYWDEPNTFKPSRFLGEWPRDAFLPFSGGARACIGRRFSETEAVAVISMLILRYKITVKEEAQFTSETFEERQARLTKSASAITVYPIRAPLVFTRR